LGVVVGRRSDLAIAKKYILSRQGKEKRRNGEAAASYSGKGWRDHTTRRTLARRRDRTEAHDGRATPFSTIWLCRASSRDEDAQTADDGRRHSGHSGHSRIGDIGRAISSKRSNRSIKKARREGGRRDEMSQDEMSQDEPRDNLQLR
jgi:hypothetical protein